MTRQQCRNQNYSQMLTFSSYKSLCSLLLKLPPSTISIEKFLQNPDMDVTRCVRLLRTSEMAAECLMADSSKKSVQRTGRSKSEQGLANAHADRIRRTAC